MNLTGHPKMSTLNNVCRFFLSLKYQKNKMLNKGEDETEYFKNNNRVKECYCCSMILILCVNCHLFIIFLFIQPLLNLHFSPAKQSTSRYPHSYTVYTVHYIISVDAYLLFYKQINVWANVQTTVSLCVCLVKSKLCCSSDKCMQYVCMPEGLHQWWMKALFSMIHY